MFALFAFSFKLQQKAFFLVFGEEEEKLVEFGENRAKKKNSGALRS